MPSDATVQGLPGALVQLVAIAKLRGNLHCSGLLLCNIPACQKRINDKSPKQYLLSAVLAYFETAQRQRSPVLAHLASDQRQKSPVPKH